MLAENLENWAQQERQAGIEKGTKLGIEQGTKLGIEQGKKLGIEQGTKLGIEKTARNLLKLGVLSNDQIAEATGLDLEDIAKLHAEIQH